MINVLLFIGFFIFNVTGLTAQTYSFDDPEGILTKKEKQQLEKAIIYEIDFYNKIFPDDTLIKISDVKIIIFDKYVDYVSYEATKGKNVSSGMPIGYFPQTRDIVIYKNKDRSDFLNVCYHELSHFFIRKKMTNSAVWLNEGLACYFKSMNISVNAIKFEKRNLYLTQIKTFIALKDIDIADFITWKPAKFQQMTSYNNYGYIVAYCIIYLLLQKEENILIGMMRDMRNGLTSVAAFDQHYPGGLAQFEKDFLAYFK
ncbi:MAG: hypothetical protein FWH23_04670 [Bacteroidales bacterium]|nr:hypothetical protein [Bacteroidales bacterium]MCL2133487.1 hypothetical protein [Bacteroidales bacterium]